MIDRLRQMAIFAKTIDHGSFRGAAGELNLSPSVVSHHISQLEDHLGVALIYRSTRKLSLTREGERLLTATRKMLEAVEGELLELSGSSDAPSGELRVTLPSVLSQSDLTDQFAAFSSRHPRIQLTLDYSDTRRELIDDGFDFAIRMTPNGRNSATSRKLFNVRRRLVASPDFLTSRPAPRDPDDLVGWDWLILSPVRSIPLEFKMGAQKIKIKPEPRILTSDARALYRLSKASGGLALVPEFLAKDDVAAGRMRYVLPKWTLPTIDVFAVWPSNAPKHGLIHLALNALSRDAA